METCKFCGVAHEMRCPQVRAIEYYPDGTVKRVEFVAPIQIASAPLEAMPINIPTPFWDSSVRYGM